MKILWLSTSKSLYKSSYNNNDYNGVGWVGALQLEVMKYKDIELAVAFISNDPNDVPDVQDGVHYYPIYKRNNSIDKLIHYHLGYRKWEDKPNVDKVHSIIADFKPDLIQSFGFECPLADIIGNTNIPIVIHLQGIINPCLNSYLPAGLSLSQLKYYGSWRRELLLNNGFSYGYSKMEVMSRREKILFSKANYICGRTAWDRDMTSLFAPQARYFHVDELLRPEFLKASRWCQKKRETLVLVSTLSDNTYKGLDNVAKTAQVLSTCTCLKYKWIIIGISTESSLLNIIKKVYRIDLRKLPIDFAGIKNVEEIIEILQEADIYVHPSAIDNSPNSLCEAQAMGLPIIANNVGGVASLVPKGTGILVPCNAPYELSYQILQLAQSPETMKYLSNEGRDFAMKRHNSEHVISQLISMYNEIMSENQKRHE